MKLTQSWKKEIKAGIHDERFLALYGEKGKAESAKTRYMELLNGFEKTYGEQETEIFSAPGRSEIAGNHTDHQHGEVLAAAVNLDAVAVAAPSGDTTVRIYSVGYGELTLDITEEKKREEEEGTSVGLIRGVLAGLRKHGYPAQGFVAYMASEVLNGAGLSSSAAFEVLIGHIVSGLFYQSQIDAVLIAKVAQYAENVYFGKPCGLMDQMACSVGGLIHIDFQDQENPTVEKVAADFASFHHSLCITDTKGSHADLTEDYAQIPAEMKAVAAYFGKQVLREVSEEDIHSHVQELRKALGDRAVLRALHFYAENRRVEKQVFALETGDFSEFRRLVQASGDSSFRFLQNVYTNHDVKHQSMSLALAVSEEVLGGIHGVCRVHGGGFAGTIQAFVEDAFVEEYRSKMDALFGEGSCHVLKVRADGGTLCFP